MRLRTLFALSLILLILAGLSYQWIDRDVVQWVFAHPDPRLTLFGKMVQHSFTYKVWAPLATLVLIIAWWKQGGLAPMFRSKMGQLSISIFFTVTICAVVKLALGRYRPELFLTQHLYGFSGFPGLVQNDLRTSMPSDHSAIIFCLVITLVCWSRVMLWRFVLIAAGCALVIARVIYLRHFPSDVLAGVVVGMWGSSLAFYWCDLFRNRKST